MGVQFTLEESDFKGYIPDGEILPAVVVSAEVRKQPFQDKQTGEDVHKVEFKFKITDGEFEDVFVYGKTSTRYNNHPKCKLYTWSQAILGFELPVEYRLDTDDLLDQPCRVVIKLDKYKDKAGLDAERNEVVDVMPTRANMDNLQAVYAAAGDQEEPF